MRFEDAIKLVRTGACITRTSWGTQHRYVRLSDCGKKLRFVDDTGKISKNGRSSMGYYPTQEDMVTAGDWEIVRMKPSR